MTFLLENLLLIGLAVASGGLLLWPLIRGGGGAKALTPLEATQLINRENAVVVDLRDEKDYAAGSLTGARSVPFAKLADGAADLVRFKARPVVLVCGAGDQSTRALARFNELGFERAFALAGGVAAWKQAGLPLVQPGRDTSRPAPKDGSRKSRPDRGPDRSKGNRGARAGASALSTMPAVASGVAAAPAAPAAEAVAERGDRVEAALLPVAIVEPVASAAAVVVHAPAPIVAGADDSEPVGAVRGDPQEPHPVADRPAAAPLAKELS